MYSHSDSVVVEAIVACFLNTVVDITTGCCILKNEAIITSQCSIRSDGFKVTLTGGESYDMCIRLSISLIFTSSIVRIFFIKNIRKIKSKTC